MKIFKTAVLAGLMVAAVGVSAHAETTTIALSGEVASISSYSFTPQSFALTGDMTTAGNTAATIGLLSIDNNDSNGFKISISSEQNGVLRRYNTTGSGTYYPGNDLGNTTSYTIQFVPNTNPGVVGADAPSGFQSAITLATAPSEYSFINPVQATVAGKYDMKVTAASNTKLFNTQDPTSDQYRDVITLTVANL